MLFMVPKGTDVSVSRAEGGTSWIDHKTKRVSLFTEYESKTPSSMVFRSGGWCLKARLSTIVKIRKPDDKDVSVCWGCGSIEYVEEGEFGSLPCPHCSSSADSKSSIKNPTFNLSSSDSSTSPTLS